MNSILNTHAIILSTSPEAIIFIILSINYDLWLYEFGKLI